ncbi:glycosyltransferase family 4 protein [Formosa undariae]|uniref:Glycosyltransferase family 4 protein n=1 Tax=Formosa undariae TaxID=1325436 RepID=A0ABV5F543_9FLAO
MRKLAIITTHPIQYYAPWFKLLSNYNAVDVKVFYTWSQASETVEDKTFGRTIKWDIPLLEGYKYHFSENMASDPGPHHKNGIDNPNLIGEIEEWRPDVILVFGWYLKSHLKVLKYFKGKTLVWFRGDSTLLDDKPGVKKLLRQGYLTYIYRYIDKAFYVGIENKKYFKSVGLKEEQLIYAPHAIDNNRFYDSEDKQYTVKAEKWRKELGYKEEDIVILFAGKFEDKKQPDLLIHALQNVNKGNEVKLKLLLLGNGPLEEELKALSAKDRNIQFLPFQNQSMMPVVYGLCNVFCLPSQGPGETWGLAVNEAMACGKPAIVSNKVGCHSDLIIDNETGWVFDFDNQNQLESILNKIKIHNLKTIGNNANMHIKQWSFDKIVEAFNSEIIGINGK